LKRGFIRIRCTLPKQPHFGVLMPTISDCDIELVAEDGEVIASIVGVEAIEFMVVAGGGEPARARLELAGVELDAQLPGEAVDVGSPRATPPPGVNSVEGSEAGGRREKDPERE
jgi:hypothetical protein